MIEVRDYATVSGQNIFKNWLADLKDAKARAKISARISRLEGGNFGDCKPLRAGVWELRIDWGPGYRVYYAMMGRLIVLLLCGGDKRKQSSDVEHAVKLWNDYKQRSSKQ